MSVSKLFCALGALVVMGSAAEAQNLKLNNRNDQFTMTIDTSNAQTLFNGSPVRDGDTYASMMVCVNSLENGGLIEVWTSNNRKLDLSAGECGVISGTTIFVDDRSVGGNARLVVRLVDSGWGYDGPN